MKFLQLLIASILLLASTATAATIFESSTLGPTGLPISELTSQNVPGTNINGAVYAGVRFQLDQPVITSKVGGHFVSGSEGTFFGAIVALVDENDFPDSGDFSTPDFLGSTLLTFPVLSDEVFGDLSLSLDPGWYTLVFGSGLFGATASGGVVRNGMDIGNPTYIAGSPSTPGVWSDFTSIHSGNRYVLKGQIVPEPGAAALLSIACLPLLLRRKSCLKCNYHYRYK